jgi:hypothetical protein
MQKSLSTFFLRPYMYSWSQPLETVNRYELYLNAHRRYIKIILCTEELNVSSWYTRETNWINLKMCIIKPVIKSVGKNLPNTFPIHNRLKQRDVLRPLLFSFAFRRAITKAEVSQECPKLNWKEQFCGLYWWRQFVGLKHTLYKKTQNL